MSDIKYMKLAIELAKKGGGFVNPNPLVGSVIVKDNQIIGQGYHEYYGGLHAERNALKNCTISPKGAKLYVTLEPCCHYGKTPPCSQAIIDSGISEVIIGTLDPNPLVAGKGVKVLEKNNIKVKIGVLEKECQKLNKIFLKYISTKIPYVIMKYAMTIDGKITTYKNKSKWISSKKSRLLAQKTRHNLMAIMVGVNTVINDDPNLTCRLENCKQPIRIVCDTHLRLPINSKIVQTANQIKTYIATSSQNVLKIQEYQQFGCHIIKVEKLGKYIDLKDLMIKIGELGIDSILLEGGSTLNWSALEQGIVDEVHAFIAPKIFGGSLALTPVGGQGVSLPKNAIKLKPYAFQKVGQDYLIESEVVYSCLQVSSKK